MRCYIGLDILAKSRLTTPGTAPAEEVTLEARSAGVYGGCPEDYAAALKKARKRRARQDDS